MDQFLSSAVCLGNLLNEMGGYQLKELTFDFAGRGKLFKTHGFINVLGSNELLPKLEIKNTKQNGGLYDDSLFNMVYSRFLELLRV